MCTTVTTFNSSDSSSNVLNKAWFLQLVKVNHPCVISLEDVIDMPSPLL